MPVNGPEVGLRPSARRDGRVNGEAHFSAAAAGHGRVAGVLGRVVVDVQARRRQRLRQLRLAR